MADLMEYVNVLADQIGPRPVSTEEENEASLYVSQELSDAGLDVRLDEFATPSGVRWPYVIAFVASALGTVISGIGIFVPGISLSMFIIGLILVAAGLFIYFTEYNNRPVLSKMRASGVSQNVVAKYVPANATRDTRRRKIIIAAHVDTVRAQPEASPGLISHTPLLRKILFYCMFGLLAVLFIRLLPLPWPELIDNILWVISLVASLFVLAAAACIAASRFTPYISGGNDNASAVAVLISVARLLANPDERERFVRTRGSRLASFVEEEYGEDEFEDGLAPSLEELDEPVLHNAEEAYAEGLVPEGAEITYDEDGDRVDATVAFPSLSPEEQLDVLADAAAEELHFDTMSTGAFSLDDVEFDQEDATGAIVNPAKPGAISEMRVPDLDFTLDEEIEQSQKRPAERLDDAVIFAEYMGADDEPVTMQEDVVEDEGQDDAQPQAEVPVEEEVLEEEVVEEEAPDPAPVYMPIETPTRSREERPQVARPVPSWYAAAKEKAAKDLEKKAVDTRDEQPGVLSYRSRFADSPAMAMSSRQDQEEPEEPVAEELVDEVVEEQVVSEETVAEEQVEAPASEEAIEVPVEEVVEEVIEDEGTLEPEPEPEPINLVIPDDQLDELSPDTTGLFAPIESARPDGDATDKPEGARKELTSRIPNIGSSDDKEREERRSAHESRAARGARPELQDVPAVENDDIIVEQPGIEPLETIAAVEFDETIEPVLPAASNISRKKPKARHLTQQFKPTRATRNRDIQLGDNRQEVAVSSTYEDTPQSAPARDPFAPKDEKVSERPVRRAPRQRTDFSAARTQASDVVVPAANTSSFPSLTGSFPAINIDMPTIDAGDFSDSNGGVIADDSALDNFMAAGQTTEINIPESRFRNAVDKVGGLFNRKGRESQDDYADGASDGWNDEDDYGWKGGGYFEEEAESAYDAVRQRAAQIRESVVTMSENDLLDKEVWFVALGASGAGGQGMKNFLDLHSSELRGALIINLEAVGAGTLSYVDVEGTGRPCRGDRRLMNLVRKASKEISGSEMKPRSLEWRNTDATPAMSAGMRALTIMGFADNGVAPVEWHCAGDTSEIVEEGKLEYMTQLLLKVIENS